MHRNAILSVVTIALMLSGCVWKSEYKSKLAEIEGLQQQRTTLEEKLKATEKELASVKQNYEELLMQKNALAEENAAIKSALEAKRDQLAKEVVELRARLTEARRMVDSHEKELEEKNREVLQLKGQAEQLQKEKEQAIAGMKDTYESLVKELKQEIKEGEIQITQLKDRLTVNMVEKILFDSGSAVIKKNGKKVLDRVADILKGVSGHQIKVEGHTDNVPIGPTIIDKFPTNWELATARATTVVRYLQERGVDPKLLSAEGYAEYRPVDSNDREEGRAKNRRIEIVLVPLDVSR
jgi:chemotaxis protein MotB